MAVRGSSISTIATTSLNDAIQAGNTSRPAPLSSWQISAVRIF
jgi:hypothetical protein